MHHGLPQEQHRNLAGIEQKRLSSRPAPQYRLHRVRRCAIVCPEAIIEIYTEEAGRIPIATTPAKKDASHLIEEKR